jgi:hypothetical protein
MVWWDFPDTESMRAVLAEFESGEAIPFAPSHSVPPGFAQQSGLQLFGSLFHYCLAQARRAPPPRL